MDSVRALAVGAGIFGAGGGGDTRAATHMAEIAIGSSGAVTLVDLDDLPDDGTIMPLGMVGAPTILAEKLVNGNEGQVLREHTERLHEKSLTAIMCFEMGGVNAVLPLVWAAQARLPVVDADLMGRAFPELQMTTAHLAGLSAAPAVLTDERRNVVTFESISNNWAERMARDIVTTFGGSGFAAIYAMSVAEAKGAVVRRSLSRAMEVGRRLEESRDDPIGSLTDHLNGVVLLTGKIGDVERRTGGGFVRGSVVVEGLEGDHGRLLRVEFQNENLVALEEGAVVATVPDIISILDSHTGRAVTTEHLRYGQRVDVIAFPCDPLWRSREGLQIVGPAAFGYPLDYVPLEGAHGAVR